MPALKKQNEKEKRKKEEEGREGKKEEAETVEVTLGGRQIRTETDEKEKIRPLSHRPRVS